MINKPTVDNIESRIEINTPIISKTPITYKPTTFYNPIDVAQYGLALDGPKEPDNNEDLVAIVLNKEWAIAITTRYHDNLSQEINFDKASVFYFLVPHKQNLKPTCSGIPLTERNLMLLEYALKKNSYDLERKYQE